MKQKQKIQEKCYTKKENFLSILKSKTISILHIITENESKNLRYNNLVQEILGISRLFWNKN